MTHLRKIMLEELQRRNYAESTIHAYIRTVDHFSHHFHRPPTQLGPEHIREGPFRPHPQLNAYTASPPIAPISLAL